MAKIDILMATYNGEKYIKEQILSLLGQSLIDWNLIIHDDGSTDNTINIIKELAASDSRIKLVEDNIKYGSAALNFMHILQFTEADYVMFCDQDDIWYNKKIETMLECIAKKNNDIPQIVYSSAYIWSDNKNTGLILPFFFPQKLQDFLFLNMGINGCMAMFNKKALDLMKIQSKDQAMHDHLLNLIGVTLGEITYIKEPLMLYRRHSQTVTNGKIKLNPVKRLLGNRNIPVIDKKHYEAIKLFYKENRKILDKKTSDLIEIYLKMPQNYFIKNISQVIKYKFSIGNSVFPLITKIVVRPFFK